MSLDSRIEAQLSLFESGIKSKSEILESLRSEFYALLGGIQTKQIKSLKKFKSSFEEKEGFTPESLDFKSVIDLVTKFEIIEFNLIDNYNSSQKTLLEVTN